ncbi:hypothetical protein [Fibrobacter intestinalis]|nr:MULTISPECIES: hypothetical protein [Fibrobacter]
MSREDSLQVALKNFSDSIYTNKIKNYRSLGELNSETFFEGSSGNFKIEKLPSWFYNRIYVQIESVDGRELNGSSYAGGKRAKISGQTATFAVVQKNRYAPTFELAFPEYRRVKLKWWVEVGAPKESVVAAVEDKLSEDSVHVLYSFGESPYTNGKISLTFDRRNFTDGKIPVVKKLSFDPQGISQLGALGIRGNIYDFEANINIGDSVTLAIPLDFDYNPETDSITIEHFIETENRWMEEPVDSVVGNVAYFKVGHFSWLRSFCRKVAKTAVSVMVPASIICSQLSETCANVVDDIVNGVAEVDADILSIPGNLISGAVEGVAWIWNLLESLLCLDFSELKNIFGLPRTPTWEIEQGILPFDVLHEQGTMRIDDTSLIGVLKDLRKSNFVKLEDSKNSGCSDDDEICKWKTTRNNLDILLADAILAKMDPKLDTANYGKATYSYSGEDADKVIDSSGKEFHFKDYFMTNSGLIENAAWFIEGLKSCYGVLNYASGIAQNYINLYKFIKKTSYTGSCRAVLDLMVSDKIDFVDNGFNCSEFIPQIVSDHSILNSHSEKLIKISEAMVRVSLLAWLNKDDFRDFSLLAYKSVYDGIRSWLELAGPFFDFNNVAIKAYGSIALYEYIHYGTDNNFAMVNGALKHHYGSHGGYSEGTGYSQYIWDDLTYVLAAMKVAYANKGDTLKIEEKFLKSPDYMFEFSRPVANVGLVPIEIDDGVTYNPDYRVWAKIKNDAKYIAMSNAYPLKCVDGKINSLLPFGFPSKDLYLSNGNTLPVRGKIWSNFQDGIGLISVENVSGDTVTLSMIAESGNLWTRGQAHDQQDNLSITLASSRNGFILQDRGYTGFGDRAEDDAFHRYNSHNVLTYNKGNGQEDNRIIGFSELWPRINDFTGSFPGALISTILAGVEIYWNIFGIDHEFRVEGGNEASVLGEVKDFANKAVGYTAETKIDKPAAATSVPEIYNNRSILYFGGNFWVIDRPTSTGMKWLGNSPVAGWDVLKSCGLKVFGSSQAPLDADSYLYAPIKQNGARTDFPGGELLNHSFSFYDKDAATYVMTYAVDDENFEKTLLNCPKDYQCFENASANKRLIVPPRNSKFRICKALPANECSGEVKSSGITMMIKKSSHSWTADWVLDGKLTKNENSVETDIAGVTVSRTGYVIRNLDGSTQNGKYESPNLPAIPLLLLR